jgi:uncharacterized coiled-coil protein SlyX
MAFTLPKYILTEKTLKLDYGDQYYLGSIEKTIFPSTIKDPISILKKSINSFTDETTTISHTITPIDPSLASSNDSKYIIHFKYVNDYCNICETIEMPLVLHKKEQMDYINERFAEMTTEITSLHELVGKMEKKILRLTEDLSESEEEKAPPPKVQQVSETMANSKRRARTSNA